MRREAGNPQGNPLLLDVRRLSVSFPSGDTRLRVVQSISFSLQQGEALGLVGESGSGKSMTALALLGLVPPPGEIESGEVLLEGRDLLTLKSREIQHVRGSQLAMIFQNPMTSLNPVLSVGFQVSEALQVHRKTSREQAREKTCDLLDLVGIPNPSARLSDFPHQFSGGQRQRIMIAMALACDPKLLIADEPTTALDVTIQAQIVALVENLQRKLGMAVLWISHDLALVAGLVDRVAVMYAGKIVEISGVETLFQRPLHPYTQGLLKSIPGWGESKQRLYSIAGAPPVAQPERPVCAFAPRCPFATNACLEQVPELDVVSEGHEVACLRWSELEGCRSE